MSVIYHFSNLQELAAYIDNKGIEIASRTGRTKQAVERYHTEGLAWRAVADLIRNTVIEDTSRAA